MLVLLKSLDCPALPPLSAVLSTRKAKAGNPARSQTEGIGWAGGGGGALIANAKPMRAGQGFSNFKAGNLQSYCKSILLQVHLIDLCLKICAQHPCDEDKLVFNHRE